MGPAEQVLAYARGRPWQCSAVSPDQPGAAASIFCHATLGGNLPLVIRLTLFEEQRGLERAYEAALAQSEIRRNTGQCGADSWGGERPWSHGLGEAGGRVFCRLDSARQETLLTWTSELGTKILGSVELQSLQHPELYRWWRTARHEIV
jgi:hypothetical protein